MASRTIVDSVPRVDAPPANLRELEAELDRLRRLHPGAIIERYLDKVPTVEADVRIAAGAVVVGDVHLRKGSSVWYGCVLRADVNRIDIGERSNLQDGCVVHLGDRDPTIVEADVVVGHRAVLHGCHVERGCLIGMQATILDGARIGQGSVVASCALVTAGLEVAPRSLVVGIPGKVVKTLDAASENFHTQLAAKYLRLSHNYRQG